MLLEEPLELMSSYLPKVFTNDGKKKSSTRYPLANYLSYDHVTPKYQSYLTKGTSFVEPKTFKEAARDAKWIGDMKLKIQALEDNKTCVLVDLPHGNKFVGSNGCLKLSIKQMVK